MKALARSFIWWPVLDSDIEETVRFCNTCQQSRHALPKAPLHPWEWSNKPKSRLHIDFAGPIKTKIFLIVVDAHSKWLEVLPISSLSSANVIGVLRRLFTTHGIPEVIVSDNGAAFISDEMKLFMKSNGIRGVSVAPYHPASNGQAERMVQTAKNAIRRMGYNGNDFNIELARFLLGQHIIPNATTGKSPSELLMNKKLRTVLNKLHPDLQEEIQMRQKEVVEKSSNNFNNTRQFQIGDPVYTRDYTPGNRSTPAQIVETTGPVSYRAKSESGEILRRHVDQLRSRLDERTEDLPQLTEEEIIASPEENIQSSSTNIETNGVLPITRPQRTKRSPVWTEDDQL